MNVKFKKLHKDAVDPVFSSGGAAGADLTAISEKVDIGVTGLTVSYDTGIAVEIPNGYVGLLFPRSSVTTKTTLMLGNSVGVIDSDYRGSIQFKFKDVARGQGKKYEVGEKIGQLVIVPIPVISFTEVDELTETHRGDGGFGSTDGKNPK